MSSIPTLLPMPDRGPLPRLYVVRRGDSLSAIAYQVYGHAGDWPYIAQANAARLPNPNFLTVGQVLWLPDIKERPG
jgi:nucleoid-associated protein YgaU